MGIENAPAANAGKRSFGWMGGLLIACVVAIMGLGYGMYAMQSSFQQRVATLESSLDSTAHQFDEFSRSSKEQATAMASDMEALTQRLGVTTGDLEKARQQFAQRIKQQQELVDKKLETGLAAKASSSDVDTLRQEATTKLAAVQEGQKDADAKIGNVTNEVTVVKQDLASARRDFGRDLTDVKNTLNDGIARNASELAQLRKKGERDYVDLDLKRNSKTPFQQVGDIQLSVSKTDPKRQKYSVVILVDDNHLEKKDRTANEPVQFLVGHDKLRYELVINRVDKDRIQGYLSTPKDKVLSAEGPTTQANR